MHLDPIDWEREGYQRWARRQMREMRQESEARERASDRACARARRDSPGGWPGCHEASSDSTITATPLSWHDQPPVGFRDLLWLLFFALLMLTLILIWPAAKPDSTSSDARPFQPTSTRAISPMTPSQAAQTCRFRVPPFGGSAEQFRMCVTELTSETH
jgi:hypothetical protein